MERTVLKSDKVENQEIPGNLPNIEKLFACDWSKFNTVISLLKEAHKEVQIVSKGLQNFHRTSTRWYA